MDRDRYLAARRAWGRGLVWTTMPAEQWVPGTLVRGAAVEVGKRPLFADWPRASEEISPWTTASGDAVGREPTWEVVAVRAYWEDMPEESLLWRWTDGVAMVTEETPRDPTAAALDRLKPLRGLLYERPKGGHPPGREMGDEDIRRAIAEIRRERGRVNQRNVADKLVVSKGTVERIVKGRWLEFLRVSAGE